ncbi:hypothetical protein ACFVWF_23555 [Rhodococcus qingshengii]|uniref:hypothetical protein n=1 Tax=Rhodococcus qingshengii TaxID=334542 RepID=UPI0036D9AD9D
MPTKPIHPFLWELTLPAVHAAKAAVDEHVRSGKYVSRTKLAEYTENEHGWPTTKNPGWYEKVGDDQPIAWGEIFVESPDLSSKIAIANVPALHQAGRAVVDFALANPEFERRISILSSMRNGDEWRELQIQFEYVRYIVAAILSRADALDAWSDDELLDLYIPLERAKFADVLSGDLIVPICLMKFDIGTPLQISNNIRIEPISEPMQRARALDAPGYDRVSPYVAAAATHAIVVTNIQIDNQDQRRYGQPLLDDHPSRELVDRALQCLHILTGRDVGYAQAIIRPHDWTDDWIHDLPPIRSAGLYARYPESFDSARNRKSKTTTAAEISALPTVYENLEGAAPNIALAARRAVRAVMRNDSEDRTVDSTIGLEALLVPEGGQELKHRMAQRAAAALSEDFSPEFIYEAARRVYDHRSAIVHGNPKQKEAFIIGDTKYFTRDVAPELLILLLRNNLSSERSWTPADLDLKILRALAEQGRGGQETATS